MANFDEDIVPERLTRSGSGKRPRASVARPPMTRQLCPALYR